MTEGTGHVIDPAGDARRALQDAVTSHGPEVLSDATVMDHLCRTQLTALPGECILIVSAARADVPALLTDAIPQFGNYGAIQSVASTLAQASDLDGAASLWVVREFARALGLIAPGGTQSMPRPGPGGTGAEAPGAAVATGEAGAGVAVTAGMSAGAGAGGGTGVPGGPELAGGPQPGMAGGPQPGMGGGPQPAGGPAPQGSSGSRLFTRNTVGIAAAIALVAGYLGVAAVAHLSPFPAKTVAATSSESAGTGPGTSPATTPATTPATSPAGSPDASPTSDYEVLLSKIPAAIQGRDNCHLTGTQYGATAVSQCSRLSLPAGTIIYYLYPSQAALGAGLSTFLASVHFKKQRECTTGNDFTDFLTECRTQFHNQTPFMTGSIAEYTSTSNDPIIASTDNQQNVMAVLVGTNPGDLLSYWKQLTWIKD
ncbi:MAG TPA: hypothetical protein VE888_11395 [Streptosporangiaceae bacterium]|nr:hypothetical protein [Streptosporangiaceae bacterium]